MNHDEISPIDPELEARIVAWVLGEASAFEAAELERHLEERPELVIFKRRIEAVHGLVGEAARPAEPMPRLSVERRSKLLATIGAGAQPDVTVTALRPLRVKPWWRIPTWIGSVAACLLAGIVLINLFVPHFGLIRPKSTQESEMRRSLLVKVPMMMDQALAENREAIGKKENAIADAMTLAEKRKRERTGPAEFGADLQLRSSGAPTAGVMATRTGATTLSAFTIEGKRDAAYKAAWSVRGATEPMFPPTVSADIQLEKPALPIFDAPSDVGLTFSAGASAPIGPSSSSRRKHGASLVWGGAQTKIERYEKVVGKDVRTGLTMLPGSTRPALVGTGGALEIKSLAAAEEVAGGAPTENKVGWVSDGLAQSAAYADRSAFLQFKPPLVGATSVVMNEKGNNRSIGQESGNRPMPMGTSITLAEASSGGAVVEPASSDDGTVQLSAFSVGEANPIAGGKVAALAQLAGATPEVEKSMSAPEASPSVDQDRPINHSELAIDESLRAEVQAQAQPFSTFSLHVSDVSFRLAQAALERGEVPDPASIRPEEFYNAFDYGDPAPVAGEPVACRIEQAAAPFLQQRNLVRIAMKVPATGRDAGQPLHLTVLLDTSGSMEREDRVDTVRRAMGVLASLLGPADRVTLIGFARQPRLLAEGVPGDQASRLVDIVAHTPAEGGTNLEEALKLAGAQARGQFQALAQNRIVVLTDGAANLGNDDPTRLAGLVATLRQQGIAFDACGIGVAGLDDSVLEALTRKGDGRYYVINSPEEADAGFARKLAGAFHPAAENVKVQVRFNPARVQSYRLIGFEQHRLRTEDFRNDKVDAAELAAEEAAVALYQVQVRPDGEGELGDVFVRFRNVATGEMVERSWTLTYVPQPPAFDQASPSLQLAGTAAFLAEKLRGGAPAATIRLSELAPAVNRLRTFYSHDARVQQLTTMFGQARRLLND